LSWAQATRVVKPRSRPRVYRHQHCCSR